MRTGVCILGIRIQQVQGFLLSCRTVHIQSEVGQCGCHVFMVEVIIIIMIIMIMIMIVLIILNRKIDAAR